MAHELHDARLAVLLLLAACSPTSSVEADASTNVCASSDGCASYPLSCWCDGPCSSLDAALARFTTCGSGSPFWVVRYDCPGEVAIEWFDTRGGHVDYFDSNGGAIGHVELDDATICTRQWGSGSYCRSNCSLVCGTPGPPYSGAPCGMADSGADGAKLDAGSD